VTRESRKIESYVIRYVPNVVSGEVVNIGVLAIERRGHHVCSAVARCIPSMERVLRLDPNADVELLQSFCRDVDRRLSDPKDREAFLQMMQDSFSNSIQVMSAKGAETTDNLERAIESLASHYLT
jgi:hypothetical protein